MTTVVLAVLALVLAGPVPWLLGTSPGLRRTPRAAVALWQAVALAAVLAALGAGLSLVTDRTVGERSPGSDLVGALALLVTVVVLGRLLVSGHRVGRSLRTLRRRHRELVDLLAEDRHGVRIVDHDAPTAYCLPGFARSRVVVSRGALDVLGTDELEAILVHERAHLRARHDLVLEAFVVLQQAFPAVVTSRRALGEVELLVEVLADRAARRRCGPRPLVSALSELSRSAAPTSTLAAAAGSGLAARLDLLLDERPHRTQATLSLALAAAVLVLPTLLVVAPWLQAVGAG